MDDAPAAPVALAVNWFAREPGGSTTYFSEEKVLGDPTHAPEVIWYLNGNEDVSLSRCPSASRVAGPNGARKVLVDLKQIIAEREALIREMGWPEFQVSVEHPIIRVIIDEPEPILAVDPECFARVSSTGRKLGIRVDSPMTIYVEPTTYEVCALPRHYKSRRHFTYTVEYRGADRWAVCRNGFCHDASGRRKYESSPSNRSDDFLTRFRFTLDQALEIARRLAPEAKVNRSTVADALANGPEWL